MKKIIKRNIPIVLAVVCFWTIGIFTDVICPIKRFLGVPCPTCGVSRALFALLRLNFTEYVTYNVMAPFLIAALILLVNIELFKKKRTVYAVAYVILILNSIYYVVRLAVLGNAF